MSGEMLLTTRAVRPAAQAMRGTDWGKEVVVITLLNQVIVPQKMIKTVDQAETMTVSVSGKQKSPFLSAPPQFLLQGIFGNGGATHDFEVDILPGAVLTLPGSNIDANLVQELPYAATAGGTYGRDPSSPGLEYIIRASAIPGDLVYDARALRTYKFRQAGQAGGAGVGWSWPIPPFAKSFMIRSGDPTSYAANVDLWFQNAGRVNPDGSTSGTVELVETWTGPQILAVLRVGETIPIPTFANTILLQNSVPGVNIFFLEFEIGL